MTSLPFREVELRSRITVRDEPTRWASRLRFGCLHLHPPSSATTMATFSDGGDVAAMADHDPAGNMRLYLQNLLDNKEKQLQSAATLGHQLLAQRVELEERIKQMQELELDSSGSDDGLDVSVRDKYRELADAITAWDTENEQLTSVFGSKVSGDPHRTPVPDLQPAIFSN